MKYLIVLFCIAIFACTKSDKIAAPAPDQPAPLGYSLGLGCQGMCLGDSQATEIRVGVLAKANTDIDSMLIFDSAATVSVYIPDSLRLKYWNKPSFMAAIAVRQRSAVRLPDHRLDMVGDSCLTWNQAEFTDSIPCIPILAILP